MASTQIKLSEIKANLPQYHVDNVQEALNSLGVTDFLVSETKLYGMTRNAYRKL